MAYRLKRPSRIGPQLRRIADSQLRRAIDELTTGGDRAIHSARRRVKKVRALLRLIDPRGIGPQAHGRLREASRRLAPIADAEAAMRAFARLTRGAGAPPRPAQEIVGLLLQDAHDRAARASGGMPARTAQLLAAARLDLAHLRVHGRRFEAAAPGMRRGIDRSRKAMDRALRRPNGDMFHRWRKRVKAEWLQMRLVAPLAGRSLAPLTRRLALLDNVLGEHHDISLIESTVTAAKNLPRHHAAACLLAMRRRRAVLRRRAARLGKAVRADPAARVVRTCRRAWGGK